MKEVLGLELVFIGEFAGMPGKEEESSLLEFEVRKRFGREVHSSVLRTSIRTGPRSDK